MVPRDRIADCSCWSSLRRGQKRPGLGVARPEPPGQHGLGVLVGPLFLGLITQGQGAARHRQVGRLLGLEDGAIEPDVADADVVQPRRRVPLSDLERNRGLDRGRELVRGDVGLLNLAVDIDLHARGLRRAIIRDQHVGPLVQGKLRTSHQLQRVLGPPVHEVGGDSPTLNPEVPTAVVVLIVHAGDDRPGLPAPAQPDPGTEGEGVGAFEIARIDTLEGRPRRIVCLAGVQQVRGARPQGEPQLLDGNQRRQRFTGLGSQPLREIGPGGRRSCRDAALNLAQLEFELRPAVAIPGLRHEDDRGRVLDVPVEGVLGGVVEEGRQLVELTLGERVKLVIVAHGAVRGEAEPHLRDGLGPIARVVDQVLLGDGPSLIGGHVAAVEARGNLLVEGVPGEQVAGELLDGEPVERHVLVEHADHPVAVGPHLAVVVEVVAVRVGITRGVEPVAGAMFAPAGRFKQAVDKPRVRVRCLIGHERLDHLRRRGQAGQIKAEPPDQCPPIGFGGGFQPLLLELRQDEAIDRIADPRLLLHRGQGRPAWCDQRPVRLIRGAGLDPFLQEIFLPGRQRLVQRGRRHELLGVRGIDAREELATLKIAGRDGPELDGGLAAIEPQVGLAGRAVGPVASETVLRQDRPDVAIILGLLRGRRGAARERQQQRPHQGGTSPAPAIRPAACQAQAGQGLRKSAHHRFPRQERKDSGAGTAHPATRCTSRTCPTQCGWPSRGPPLSGCRPAAPQQLPGARSPRHPRGGNPGVIPNGSTRRHGTRKEVLQPAQLAGQERVAATASDQVMEPAIHGPRFLDEPVPVARLHGGELPQVHHQRLEVAGLDPATRQAYGLALQGRAPPGRSRGPLVP